MLITGRAVWLTVALVGVGLCGGPAIARTRRGAGRVRAKPPAGLVIELKTTRVVLESNRPEAVLEAMLGPDADDPGAAAAGGAAGGAPTAGASDAKAGGPGSKASGAPASASASEAAEGPGDDASPEPLPLEEEPGKWEVACAAPCERSLPREALFRISGPGITTSSTFHLSPSRSEAKLRVKAGSSRWYWTGILASAFGGSFVIGGAAPPLLGGGSFSTTEKVLTGAGVLLLAGGLPLFILNRTTVAVF